MTMQTASIAHSESAKNATVKLTSEEREGIKTIATLRNRTPHYIMKEAIQLYLKRAEAEKEFIQSALDSREHLRTTGLHITQDEFSAWVQTIQKNPKTPMPVCHK
jgi:predicted transcriptional regulator